METSVFEDGYLAASCEESVWGIHFDGACDLKRITWRDCDNLEVTGNLGVILKILKEEEW